AEAALAGARAGRRADGTPIGVLVVDEEPSLAELLASVLRYEGWEIRTAGDGSGAVRAAREFRPDAVVLDIMLPDFDGLEVLRRGPGPPPPAGVVVLTPPGPGPDPPPGPPPGGRPPLYHPLT